MTAPESAMHGHWRRDGAIVNGGTVLGIALSATGGLWLATSAGLWQGEPGRWRPVDAELRTAALTMAGGLLLAADAPSGIRYSADDGAGWFRAWVDGTTSLVTCFAVSPNFAHDRVLLAGTAGAGILRSTDGGRYWQLTNVGLSDYVVLALAVAPTWSRREIAFAATEAGVYRSPNGGRAWKHADRGLDGVTVQALAISPLFAADTTVYAGTEQHGIFRSADGGDCWQPLPASASFGAINSLWVNGVDAVQTLIAGTGDGMLIRSTDRGASWSVVAESWPVLVLAGHARRVYAGLDEGGLLISDDAGERWQEDAQLAARDLTRLAACDGGPLLAFGPTAGAWRSLGPRNWQPLPGVAELGTLFTLKCTREAGWYAATDAGLFRSTDDGTTWRLCLETHATPIAVIATNETAPAGLWAGASDGTLWHSGDADEQWSCLGTVAPGQPLVALALVYQGHQRLVIAASFDASAQRVTVWRSPDSGARWESWLAGATASPRVSICPGDGLEDTWVSLGSRLWRWNGAQWQSMELDSTPIAALLRVPGMLVVATARSVYVTLDGTEWETAAGSPGGVIDLALTSGDSGLQTIVGLEPGGVIWQCVPDAGETGTRSEDLQGSGSHSA